MSPLPALTVNKTLFEQIHQIYSNNPVLGHQRVSDVMFCQAIDLNVQLDGQKWIQALVLTVNHKTNLFSKNTLMRLLRTYAREVIKNYKKGWQSVSVYKIFQKQFQQPVLGKVPFRSVPSRDVRDTQSLETQGNPRHGQCSTPRTFGEGGLQCH